MFLSLRWHVYSAFQFVLVPLIHISKCVSRCTEKYRQKNAFDMIQANAPVLAAFRGSSLDVKEFPHHHHLSRQFNSPPIYKHLNTSRQLPTTSNLQAKQTYSSLQPTANLQRSSKQSVSQIDHERRTCRWHVEPSNRARV